MSVVDGVLHDLALEGQQLDAAVAELSATELAGSTPAAGWSIADQIAHLAWTDEAALAAAQAASGDVTAWDELVLRGMQNLDGFVDAEAHRVAAEPDLLPRWRAGRASLAAVLRAVPTGVKLPWFGPPMSPASMATARFMETWAHALDVHQALGDVPEPTDRIRHVAHLGVRTRNFAFGQHQLPAPAEEFGVTLVAPSGDVWTFGPPEAKQTVTGPAYDFCLLVTQRSHRQDLALEAVGEEADRWLDIAQAFAGPPGTGREARR